MSGLGVNTQKTVSRQRDNKIPYPPRTFGSSVQMVDKVKYFGIVLGAVAGHSLFTPTTSIHRGVIMMKWRVSGKQICHANQIYTKRDRGQNRG